MVDYSPMAIVSSLTRPRAKHAEDPETISNISNTAFTAGVPKVQTRFMAPYSGRVLCVIAGGMRDNGGSTRVFMGLHLWEKSVSTFNEIIAPGHDNQLGSCPNSGAFHYGCRISLIENLRPGYMYLARLEYAVGSGSTSDIRGRFLSIIPVT